jgi:hypothetical protein
MIELRKNEFIDLLEMNELIYIDKDKFIHTDIPTLGKITYYPKANKLQICKTNSWRNDGFDFIKNILNKKEISKDEFAIEFAEWICKHHETDAIVFGILDIKELLKTFKSKK